MADRLTPAALARELGISPQRVRQLAAEGRIPATTTPGGHRRFDLDDVRAALSGTRSGWHVEHSIHGLREDAVWREVEPHLAPISPAARSINHYAVTEMVNNAIDHSSGDRVTVRVTRTGERIRITVADDGIGVFERVRRQFDLPDHFAAVAELTKGKRTSAPDEHSGEGIFFTSKAVDVFELAANGIIWITDNKIADHAVGTSDVSIGTLVALTIDADTDRELIDVFRAFSRDHDFVKTRPVIKLFEIGTTFVSRSEAKRLLAGMEQFEEITLDFAGVTSIGQGFADGVFRVWARAHPSVDVHVMNANGAVQFMIDRSRPRDG